MSGDSVVISSVAYPDPRKLALVADMQYHEPYTSAALNRKLRGILREGFYTGFIPRPGGGLNLLITSVDSEQKTGSASINIGDDYQITVRQQKDVILKLSAGTKFAIILKAVYTLGSDTYQVNSKSSIQAAEIYAKTFTDSYELGDGELLICTVDIPAGAKEITIDMIDSTAKKVAAIGIELSNDFHSDEEKKAATPKAVKDGIAHHEQKQDPHSQYAPKESPVLTGTPEAPTASAGTSTNQIANTAFVQAVILGLIGGSPDTLSTLKKIADAINNDPNFSTTISNELALKAPLDSPLLTGTPTAPTAPEDTNNTQIATTAFVRRAISALVGSAPETLDTINEIATALGNDPNFATTMLNALGGKQPLDNTLTNLSGKDVAGLLAYLGLRETINRAAGALQKDQNGADIPDKKQFARTIGAVTSTTITLNESGWFKIATVVMPQSASTAVIKLYGSSGYNVGSFEQAAISELVLRAGNGSPVGITATLWRSSPTAANEVAWINTSGDTYDIYINIGRYAYGLIAQYYCTSNAGVILHTNPEFSETKPTNATNGQTYTLFNSLMKPTAGDVEALSVNGGRLNGPLGIGTDNALGGNSIALGDNDTGFKQNGDGILDTYANNQHTVRVTPGEMQVLGTIRVGNTKRLSLTSSNGSTLNAGFNLWGDANRPTVIELDDDQGWQYYSQRNPDGSVLLTVNGDIMANRKLNVGAATFSSDGNVNGSLWGGWLNDWINNTIINRFVKDIRLGGIEYAQAWNGPGFNDTPGYVITGVTNGNSDELIDGIHRRPLQKLIGSVWYNVTSI